MTAFDPIPHIRSQYIKGNESLHNVKKLNKLQMKKPGGILKNKDLNLTNE